MPPMLLWIKTLLTILWILLDLRLFIKTFLSVTPWEIYFRWLSRRTKRGRIVRFARIIFPTCARCSKVIVVSSRRLVISWRKIASALVICVRKVARMTPRCRSIVRSGRQISTGVKPKRIWWCIIARSLVAFVKHCSLTLCWQSSFFVGGN